MTMGVSPSYTLCRRWRGAVLAAFVAAVSLLVAAPARAERTVTITGGGFGHGIGMSQYGAYGRALNGKSSTEIVEHYYTGTDVGSRTMPTMRVGLLQGQGAIAFTSSAQGDGGGRVVLRVSGTPGKLAEGGPGTNWRVEPSSTGGYRVYKNSKQVKKSGNGVFGGPSTPLLVYYQKHNTLLRLSQKSYGVAYGHVELGTYQSSSCSDGYCARGVLSLSMQKYLYGLGEVPASWPQQALRAQAIAGRTYAYQKALSSGGHRIGCDCAVYDSTYDQAYIGDAKRTGSGSYWDDWVGAVDGTKGQVVLYDGAPIQALYSSSSGGYTENNENVWGGTPIPYLRGVSDKPDYAGGKNPNYKWEVKMPWSSFASTIDSHYGVGDLERFKLVKPFGVSGRVTVVKGDSGGVRIVGTKKTVRASGWSIRASLGLKDTLFRVDLGHQVAAKMLGAYRSLGGAPGAAKTASYPVPRHARRPLGRAQDFAHGRMTWTKSGKVTWLHGPLLAGYDALGREGSSLGMPQSGVWGDGGYRGATFAHGILVRSPNRRAHAVTGEWLRAYRRAGGPAGPLGVPTGAPRTSKDLPHGGARQPFSNGTVYRAPSGHAVALWGPVDARYRRLDRASSTCGYPTKIARSTRSAVVVKLDNGTLSWSARSGIEIDCG